MLSWIKNLFRKNPPLSEGDYSFSLYRPADRRIYTYFDGEKLVKADPMTLHKRVMDVGPELSIDMKVAHSGMKGAKDAHDKMVAKIRTIFSVKRYEDGGLTEQECVELLDHFLLYEDVQKKISNTSPTSPETTSPPLPPSSAVAPPTPSSTVSGSTADDTSTSRPQLSPSGPDSPSDRPSPELNTSTPSPPETVKPGS